MVSLNVMLTAKDPQQADQVARLLTEMARRSRNEDGCERFEVYRSQMNRAVFFLVERWQTQQQLDAHREAEAFKTFYEPQVLPLVERAPHLSDLLAE